MKNNKKQSLIICILLLHNSFSYTNQSTMQMWGTWFWNKMCENKFATLTVVAVLGIVGYTLKCKKTATPLQKIQKPKEEAEAPKASVKTSQPTKPTKEELTVPEEKKEIIETPVNTNKTEASISKEESLPEAQEPNKELEVKNFYKLPVNNKEVYFVFLTGNMLTPEIKVDAIVNAANKECLGKGKGIDEDIAKMGGNALTHERQKLKQESEGVRCPTGEARLTKSGEILNEINVPYVIHAVAPNQRVRIDLLKRDGKIASGINIDKDSLNLLTLAYTNSLKAADDVRATSIAFPTLGAGSFGYLPTMHDTEKNKTIAFHVLSAIQEYFKKNQNSKIETIKFVFYDKERPGLIPQFLNAYTKAAEADELNLKVVPYYY